MAFKDTLNTGDVVYGTCFNDETPEGLFFWHVGIVYDDGKNKLVFHNNPVIANKFGGNVCVEPYDVFMKGRHRIKVVRTNATKERILYITKKVKKEHYNEFLFNCEDYVLEIVEGHRRSDIRDAFKIVGLGIIILTFL